MTTPRIYQLVANDDGKETTLVITTDYSQVIYTISLAIARQVWDLDDLQVVVWSCGNAISRAPASSI